MALEQNQITELEETLQKHLKAAWSQGLETGVCTVAETILQYLDDGSTSLPDRIAKIRKFCETPLKTREKNKKLKAEE